MPAEGPLACPRCARKHSLDERFCAECGMPLVYVGRGEQQPITDAHERARKVDPRYTGGELVKVGWGRNLAEAELIQGMLLEEGIPSVQRRTRGFDVPDFLAGGPRDILVPEAARDDARALLSATDAVPSGNGAHPAHAGRTETTRFAAAFFIVLALAAAFVWVLYRITA